jgi:hypothetical protein
MGFVYLIESVRDYDTVYKIGYSKNTSKRVKEIQTGNDGNLKIIYQFETVHGQRLERVLQNMYNHKRIKNEWFNLDLKDVVGFLDVCSKVEKNLNYIKNVQSDML